MYKKTLLFFSEGFKCSKKINYCAVAGFDVNPNVALMLTSAFKELRNTYSILTRVVELLMISSRKRELSISRTMLDPAFAEISFLLATITSPEPSALERYNLTELNTPRFWFDGLLASILAFETLTSLICAFELPPKIWSALLAGLVAERIVPVLEPAGIINVAV